MSNQGGGSSTKNWPPPQGNMTTYPSVGRFDNDQAATLYVKGSSAKLTGNAGRKSMAPYSNHGQLSQQPSSGIVDLRTAPGTEGKICGSCNLGCGIEEGVIIGHEQTGSNCVNCFLHIAIISGLARVHLAAATTSLCAGACRPMKPAKPSHSNER